MRQTLRAMARTKSVPHGWHAKTAPLVGLLDGDQLKAVRVHIQKRCVCCVRAKRE